MTALSAGECVVCTEPYPAGAAVGLVAEGWAHLDCWTWTTEEHRG